MSELVAANRQPQRSGQVAGSPGEMFRNQRQALKVRALLWVSLAFMSFFFWLAWYVAQSYGLSPGDGGVLRPIGERIGLAAVVALIGLAAGAGMLIFADRYVVRLVLDEHHLEIDTLTLFGRRRRRFARAGIAGGRYSAGRSNTGRIRVDAPYLTLRVAGERLPFIIDLQAEVIDRAGLGGILAKGIADWRRDRS